MATTAHWLQAELRATGDGFASITSRDWTDSSATTSHWLQAELGATGDEFAGHEGRDLATFMLWLQAKLRTTGNRIATSTSRDSRDRRATTWPPSHTGCRQN